MEVSALGMHSLFVDCSPCRMDASRNDGALSALDKYTLISNYCTTHNHHTNASWGHKWQEALPLYYSTHQNNSTIFNTILFVIFCVYFFSETGGRVPLYSGIQCLYCTSSALICCLHAARWTIYYIDPRTQAGPENYRHNRSRPEHPDQTSLYLLPSSLCGHCDDCTFRLETLFC